MVPLGLRQYNSLSSSNDDIVEAHDDSAGQYRFAVRHAWFSLPTQAQNAISDQTVSYMEPYYTQGYSLGQILQTYPRGSHNTQQAGARGSDEERVHALF